MRFLSATLVFGLLVALMLAGCAQPPAKEPATPSTPAVRNPPSPAPDLPLNDSPDSADVRAKNAADQPLPPPLSPNQTNPAPSPSGPPSAKNSSESDVSGTARPDPIGGRMRTKTCSIELLPDRIYAGQEATVRLYAYSANNERISYLCGDEERTQGYGGLFQDERICHFDTPGQVNVWLALDGVICATAPLQVLPADGSPSAEPPSCTVLEGTRFVGMKEGLRTYEARVQFSNFPANANLSWDCQGRKFTRTLSSVTGQPPLSGALVVSCQYTFDPGPMRSLPVTIDNDYCGSLLVPGGG